MRCAIAMHDAMTSARVACPRTTSSSFITFAGLKKCRPITSPGRLVDAAIVSMFNRDVFVARMADGLHSASRRSKMACFTAMSSNTASTTRSASATASNASVGVMRPMRASICCGASLPFAAVIS